MKILVVGGNMTAMMEATIQGLAPSSIHRILKTTSRVEVKPNSTIDHVVIRNEMDTERLRGIRYDLVVEHASFPRDYNLWSLVRHMVLR